MDIKEKANYIVDELEREYPDATCSLVYDKPHELLISTRLAAQCTDARVNIVTKDLFQKYKSINDFADAELSDVEEIIKSCGLYKTKAKDIINMCIKLRDEFNCILPDTMEELTSLPGIGRKTANLVLGDIFKKEAVVVDTHCIRITNLLGLSQGKNPLSVEKQLREVLPMKKASDFCHRIVIHGRAVCVARRPDCKNCCINKYCNYFLDNK
ncbi:MAG: endonuclease III [Oscillospiraceae bacterium]